MKIYNNSNSSNDSLSNRNSLKFTLVLLTTIVTAISIIAPVIAQINRPSQDFFDQGREQLEREIQILQDSPNTPQNPQRKPTPILEVSPSPDHERKPQPLPSKTPLPTPTQ